MKIICVGRNYAAHAKEMKSDVPTEPVIFLKPQTALLTNNKPFYYPEHSKDIHYECELIYRICKNGKHIQEKFAHTYIDAYTLGIDFTARDLQQQQKEKGLPWEIAKAFDHSAVVGTWKPLHQLDENISFSLLKNDIEVQHGESKQMLFSIEKIISFVSTFITLQQGDIIFTGTPEGVGSIAIGDKLEARFNTETVLTCEVK